MMKHQWWRWVDEDLYKMVETHLFYKKVSIKNIMKDDNWHDCKKRPLKPMVVWVKKLKDEHEQKKQVQENFLNETAKLLRLNNINWIQWPRYTHSHHLKQITCMMI